MWPRRSDRHHGPYEDLIVLFQGVLIEECESFLSGSYVEQCERRGKPVPVWAWMNVLGHGTDAELRAAATIRSGDDEGHQALAFVAGELVALIDDGCLDLDAFQREVLVPLELDLIACPSTGGWSSGQLASASLRTLPMKSSHRH